VISWRRAGSNVNEARSRGLAGAIHRRLESVMKLKIVWVVSVAALAISVSAFAGQVDNKKDTRDIRRDKHELKTDAKDVHQDMKDINKDKADLKDDREDGNKADARKDARNIR
jgi:hypothetical protein